MKLILQGVDPGIVDTGMVSMEFDFRKKTIISTGQVWTGVSTRKNNRLLVSPAFLAGIFTAAVRANPAKGDYARYTYIEGFRNRGRDTYQDQQMSDLVQSIQRQLAESQVVDNTGVRKVVTKELLQLFGVARWPRTNHADLLSAARIALKGAIENVELNSLLSSVVIEQHREKTWEISTTLIDR